MVAIVQAVMDSTNQGLSKVCVRGWIRGIGGRDICWAIVRGAGYEGQGLGEGISGG